MTTLHAGGKFDNSSYKVSGGLHGVGVSVVNALSSRLSVRIHKNGVLCSQEYQRGIPQSPPVESVTDQEGTGTYIHFVPDDDIFETTDFSFDILAKRLRELAFLNSGLSISIIDRRSSDGKKKEFRYEGGITSFVGYLNENKHPLHEPPVHFTREGVLEDGSFVSQMFRCSTIPVIRRMYSVSPTTSTPSTAARTSPVPRGTHQVS